MRQVMHICLWLNVVLLVKLKAATFVHMPMHLLPCLL